MLLYLDTSALVKLYAHEADSFVVRRHVGRAKRVAIARIGYAEARAALARRARESRTRPAQLRRCVKRLDEDFAHLVVVEIDASLTQTAGDLAETHGLRGFDAIHLAAALRFEAEIGKPVAFLAFDAQLTKGARAAGLAAP